MKKIKKKAALANKQILSLAAIAFVAVGAAVGSNFLKQKGTATLADSRVGAESIVCEDMKTVMVESCSFDVWNRPGSNTPRRCVYDNRNVNLTLNSTKATFARFAEVATNEDCSAISATDGRWTAWEAYKSTRAWTLSKNYGNKRICAQVSYGSSLNDPADLLAKSSTCKAQVKYAKARPAN